MIFLDIMENILDARYAVNFRPANDERIFCSVETSISYGEGVGDTVDLALIAAILDALQLTRQKTHYAQDDASLLSKCIRGMEEA